VRARARERLWTATWILVIACAASCTHFTPYYRGARNHPVAPVADAEIDHRLLLIGDAGDPDPDGEPTLQLLARQVRLLPDRTTVVFLGDNAYERGLPKQEKKENPVEAAAKEVVDVAVVDVFDDRHEAEREIDAQVDTVRGTTARAIFVPGNHDWDQFQVGGWDRILALEDFLTQSREGGSANVSLLPPGGCPGPSPVPLGRTGQLIALDTQWWLATRDDGKPTPQNNPTKCEATTEAAVRRALIEQLESAAAQKRWSVVVGHHPLDSEGPHGGFTDARTHVFPLQVVRHYVPFYIEWIPIPIVGSIVVATRACCSPSAQDMSNGRNLHMRNALEHSMVRAADADAAALVYASGHDHSLQVFDAKRGPRYLLVSGLGSQSRASDVGSNSRTIFAHSNPAHPGFMRVDFLNDGAVRLAVLEWSRERPEGVEVYSRFLAPPGAKPGTIAAEK